MKSLFRLLNRWQWAVLTGFLLLIVGIVVVSKVFGSRKDPRLDAIRSKGQPVTLTELNAWYPAVDVQSNTALAYAGLLAPAGQKPAQFDWVRPVGRLSASEISSLAEFLNRHEQVLAGLHAVRSGPARYPVDLRQGIMGLYPHLPAVKQGTLLLCAEADYFFASGEPAKAVESLVAAADLADSLKSEPLLISHLVRMACWNLITDRMAQGFGVAKVLPQDLQRLAEKIECAESPLGLTRALAGERALGIAIFDDSRFRANMLSGRASGGGAPPPGFGVRMAATGLRLSGVLGKDRASFMDHMSNLLYATELTYPARLRVSEAVWTNLSLGRFQIMSRMLLPALGNAVRKDAECTARIRCARVMVRIEQCRRRNNERPPASLREALDAHLASAAEDPFDGQPLRYKVEGAGYVVYSIGYDMRDDGGTEPPKKNGGRPGGPGPSDVCLRVAVPGGS